MRDSVEHGGAESGDGQDHDDDAVEDHEPHRFFPGQSLRGHHCHGNEGIDPQAGGDTEGVAGDQPEGDGHDAGGQRGDSGDLGDA